MKEILSRDPADSVAIYRVSIDLIIGLRHRVIPTGPASMTRLAPTRLTPTACSVHLREKGESRYSDTREVIYDNSRFCPMRHPHCAFARLSIWMSDRTECGRLHRRNAPPDIPAAGSATAAYATLHISEPHLAATILCTCSPCAALLSSRCTWRPLYDLSVTHRPLFVF